MGPPLRRHLKYAAPVGDDVPSSTRSRKRASVRGSPRRTPPTPPALARSAAPERPRPLLEEPPHGHIVCRGCGRIAVLALDTEEELRLEAISRSAPDGWSVDLVAFSLTGACPRCRQGPTAPP